MLGSWAGQQPVLELHSNDAKHLQRDCWGLNGVRLGFRLQQRACGFVHHFERGQALVALRYCWRTADGCCKPAAWAAGSMHHAAVDLLSMVSVCLRGVAAVTACCGASCTKSASSCVLVLVPS